MNKLDFWVNWYNKEEERKLSLENSLNIPIGVLIVVFSALFYLFKEFDYEHSTKFEQASLILAGIACLLCTISAYFIGRAYHAKSYVYNALPMPMSLLDYEKGLIAFYKESKEEHEQVDVNAKVEENLIQTLAACIDVNSANNDRKSHYIYRAKRWLLYSLMTLGVGFIPFFSNSLKKPDQVYEIKLKDLNLVQEQLKTLNKNFDYGNGRRQNTTGTTKGASQNDTPSSATSEKGKRGR